ncbi:MAG: helix-turn-helix domain-containing protein [Desulfocapsaceae bacterium]
MVLEQTIELFVTETESLVLEALAQAEAPYSQRAQALLAVDAGSTIEQAAQVANLKVTQVRFWIGRFRNGRLGVFPESLVNEIESSLKTAQQTDSSGKEKKKKEKVKKSKKKQAAAPKGGKNKKLKKAKAKKADTAKPKKAKKAKKGKKAKEVKQKKKKAAKKSGKKKK